MEKENKKPGTLAEFIASISGRELTPCERVCSLAKELDRYYDIMSAKKRDLEDATDTDEKAFLKESLATLEGQKELLVKRIKQLLDSL